jgi:hypothetical protein
MPEDPKSRRETDLVLRSPRLVHEIGAILVVMAVGVLLAVLPHIAALVHDGRLEYVADGDDVLYASIAKAPYLGAGHVRDPFALPSARLPTLYTWLQFVPLAKLTKALGLPLVLIGLVWRLVGGALLGLTLYLLFRFFTAHTRCSILWSLGCALVCLSDAGFLAGRWFAQDFVVAKSLLLGSVVPKIPNGMPQFRVVTPLLNLPFFLLLLPALLWRNARSLGALAFGAICLMLCIHLYFFFWTAAVIGIGAYGLCIAYLAWRKPSERAEHVARIKLLAGILAAGLVLGAPQIYTNARTFADPKYGPILDRCTRPTHLPPGDPARSLNLRNRWEWGAIVVGACIVGALGVQNFGLLWCLLVAGFALKNSAVLTGLEFENYHWGFVTASMAEILLLCALVRLADPGDRAPRPLLKALWIVPLCFLALALVIRWHEALHAEESVFLSRLLKEERPLRGPLYELPAECSLAGPSEADLALLFTPAGKLFAFPHTLDSSLISEREVDERHALNAWLMGWNRDEYAARCRPRAFHVIVHEDEARKVDEVAQHRLQIFDTLENGRAAELAARFRVCALLLPSSAPKPTRLGPWTEAGQSPEWTLWTRSTGHTSLSADKVKVRFPLARVCFGCAFSSAHRPPIVGSSRSDCLRLSRGSGPEAR